MFFSRMYKQYYPVKSWQDLVLMNKKDRDILVKWINYFSLEIYAEAGIRREQGRLDWCFPMLYQLSQEDYDRLKSKLASKKALCELEDKVVMQIINAVLYRHKYNIVVSFFVCPILLHQTDEDKNESSIEVSRK